MPHISHACRAVVPHHDVGPGSEGGLSCLPFGIPAINVACLQGYFPRSRSSTRAPCHQVFVPAGLWSQIKRAPKAKKVRKTFETPGPKAAEALPLDVRARQIFAYFKKYNYTGQAALHAAACAAAIRHSETGRHIAQHATCLLLMTPLPAWLQSGLLFNEHETR